MENVFVVIMFIIGFVGVPMIMLYVRFKKDDIRSVALAVFLCLFMVVGVVASVRIVLSDKENIKESKAIVNNEEDKSSIGTNDKVENEEVLDDSNTLSQSDSSNNRDNTSSIVTDKPVNNNDKNNTNKTNNITASNSEEKSKEIKNIKNILEAKNDEPKKSSGALKQIKHSNVTMKVPITYALTGQKGTKWKYVDSTTKETMLINIGTNKKSMYEERQGLRDYVFEKYKVGSDDTYSFNGNDFEVYTCETDGTNTSLIVIAVSEKKKLLIIYNAGENTVVDFRDVLSSIKF